MEHLCVFPTITDYKTAIKEESIAYPNVSYVSEKCYYRGIPEPHTNAGDVVYVKNGEFHTCNVDEWVSTMGTAIAVVVIPSNHTEDGRSRAMSLVNMSVETPSGGDMTRGRSMISGCKVVSGITPKGYIVIQDLYFDDGSYGFGPQGSLPSDFIRLYSENNIISNDDMSAYDFDNDGDGIYQDVNDVYNAAPSPYDELREKNEMYFMRKDKNALADMDGENNTKLIYDAIPSSYKGGSTVVNTQAAYPPVNCARRFFTSGTEAGDWYIPSIGELGYLYVRIKAINETLRKIVGSTEIPVFSGTNGNTINLISSSFKDDMFFWELSLNNGVSTIHEGNTYSYVYARAFIKI